MDKIVENDKKKTKMHFRLHIPKLNVKIFRKIIKNKKERWFRIKQNELRVNPFMYKKSYMNIVLSKSP